MNKDIDKIHRTALEKLKNKEIQPIYLYDNRALGYNKFENFNGTIACILTELDFATMVSDRKAKSKEEKLELLDEFIDMINKFVKTIKPNISKINKNIKIEIREKDYDWSLEEYKKKMVASIKHNGTVLPRPVVILLIPSKSINK